MRLAISPIDKIIGKNFLKFFNNKIKSIGKKYNIVLQQIMTKYEEKVLKIHFPHHIVRRYQK